jgi:SAM-dependent methyltransferase
MNQLEFYRLIEQGALQGACRYYEYWFIYNSLPQQGKVLDLGSGRSMLPKAMQLKGLETIAVEIDPKCVEFQNNQGIECVAVKDEQLPFEKETFDIVTAASAIEHFEDDKTVVDEVLRVLKPGGLFILTIPVGPEYIKNRFKGKNHPLTRVYDVNKYLEVFLGDDFAEVNRKFYKVTSTEPRDYIPHESWGNRINTREVEGFGEDVGLCVLLAKL